MVEVLESKSAILALDESLKMLFLSGGVHRGKSSVTLEKGLHV